MGFSVGKVFGVRSLPNIKSLDRIPKYPHTITQVNVIRHEKFFLYHLCILDIYKTEKIWYNTGAPRKTAPNRASKSTSTTVIVVLRSVNLMIPITQDTVTDVLSFFTL